LQSEKVEKLSEPELSARLLLNLAKNAKINDRKVIFFRPSTLIDLLICQKED
jgi:hypothetical protein